MSLGLLVKPEAEADIRAGFAYYEQHAGAGDRFRDRIESLLGQLTELPNAYPVLYQNVRRALVRDFPYSLFYVVEPDRVVVLAVLHQARDPRGWPRP